MPSWPSPRGLLPLARREPAAALALALAAAVGALVVVRALALGGEHYDAYETRVAARDLARGTTDPATFPLWRSPLGVLASAPLEALGRAPAWVGPALGGAGAWLALVALTGVLARRLGARPWVAAAAALVAALDRAAWLHAPHGLPDVPATALCAAVLVLAARPATGAGAGGAPGGGAPGDGAPGDGAPADDAPGPWPARPLALGVLVGLAALARHNAGLVGLALAAVLLGPAPGGALDRRRALGRLALAAAVAAAVYGVTTTLLWAAARGSLAAGLAGHGDLLAFQREQLLENRGRYGVLQPPLMVARTVLVSAPALLLAPLGAALALRGPLASAGARVAAAWAALHLVFVGQVAGHVEARYLTPALPALAALAALPLEALARRGRLAAAWAPPAVVLGLAAGTLALGAPWEARHALDPRTRTSFPARVAEAVARARGPDGRVVWTSAHPYPVAPEPVRLEGTPFRGDPFHGIWHLGPVVLGWHLDRPVLRAVAPGAPAGVRAPADLRALVRSAGLRPGDVLVVGTLEPGTTTALAGRPDPWPPLGVGRVVAGPDGALDVDLAWLAP